MKKFNFSKGIHTLFVLLRQTFFIEDGCPDGYLTQGGTALVGVYISEESAEKAFNQQCTASQNIKQWKNDEFFLVTVDINTCIDIEQYLQKIHIESCDNRNELKTNW